MKYMRLTNSCQSFSATIEDDNIHLNWNTAITFTPVKYVSLLKLQIGPIKADDHNRLITVHTNIIARTLHNPLREITCIQIPRRSQYIESQYIKGGLLNNS